MSHAPFDPETDGAALDTLLSQHLNAPAEQLTPSSGFVHSVMDTIHQQAAEPPPLAFPWPRVLPGALASLSALIVFFVYAWTRRSPTGPVLHTVLSYTLPSFSPIALALCWSALAVCLSMAIGAAAFRLASRNP